MNNQVSKRRHQSQEWIPISETSSVTSSAVVHQSMMDSCRISGPDDDIENRNNNKHTFNKNKDFETCKSSRRNEPLSVIAEPAQTIVPEQTTTNRTTPQHQKFPVPTEDIFLTPEAEECPPPSASIRFQNFFTSSTTAAVRQSPLPNLQWADSQEVWEVMLAKEDIYSRDTELLHRHQGLQPRMRSILLDWIIEVCEVYRLHRETFHLTVDFIDRYMSITRNIAKQQLQLIGVTSLFIAAKIEEIYPPKLSEFAYVTDGACTENEILEQELVILKALKWDLCPLTVNSWLNVFLQLVNAKNIKNSSANFVFPQYSQHAFIQIARLLDLCMLDINCLKFRYSIIATSAMYHMSSEHIALHVSGYQWMDIASCVQWMAPLATTLREYGSAEVKFFQSIASEDMHNIQTHVVDLGMLEKALARQAEIENSSRASPDYTVQYTGLVTPPQSKGKERGAAHNDDDS